VDGLEAPVLAGLEAVLREREGHEVEERVADAVEPLLELARDRAEVRPRGRGPHGRERIAQERGALLGVACAPVGRDERERLVRAQLVEQGAQKSPKCHHLPSLRRAHPDGDQGRSASARGSVESVELAPFPRRAYRHHHDPNGADSKCLCKERS